MKHTTPKHGPGGAHIGFSMFGARGPLRDEEGNGSSPAPAALPPPATATPAQGEPAPVPGAASEKMLPQSQVSTLIADAKRDTEAKTRTKVLQEIADKAAMPAPKPTPKADGSMSAEDVQSLLSRDRAFTRATAKADLNERQLMRMEAALKADVPADVAAWCTAYIEDLGIAKPATQPAALVAAPAPAPAPAPVTPTPAAAPQAPTGAVNPQTTGGLVDLFNLSATQIQQMGPSGVRAELDKIRAYAHQSAGLARLPRVPERK